MGRVPAPPCPECRRGDASSPRDMSRVYIRGPNGRGYVPCGWMCAQGHIMLDREAWPYGPRRVL